MADHSMQLSGDQYYACTRPEQPPIHGVTIFDERCPRCLIAMEAAFANGIFDYVRILSDDGDPTDEIFYSVAELRARLNM